MAVPLPMPAQPVQPAVSVPVPVSGPVRPVPVPVPVPAGNRPIPAGVRPVPVSGPVSPDVPQVREDGDEDQPPDPTQKAAQAAPPWLVSLVVHMVLMIVLALAED